MRSAEKMIYKVRPELKSSALLKKLTCLFVKDNILTNKHILLLSSVSSVDLNT